MKKPPLLSLWFFILLFSGKVSGQSFGTFASAVWLSGCNQSTFFNTSGAAADLFGPSGNVFTNSNLGVHTQNSGTLILRGAGVKTNKTPGAANVCSARLHYRIYLQSGAPGSFNTIDLLLIVIVTHQADSFPPTRVATPVIRFGSVLSQMEQPVLIHPSIFQTSIRTDAA